MKIPLGISILLCMIAFSCDQPTSRLEQYEVHGIDVSHYQSHIHWDQIAGQGIHFAFVKATEGLTFNDSLYCRNWSEMKRVDIMRGAYHFYRPTLSATDQFYNFQNWVELEYGDLPPVLDAEVLDGVSKVQLISGIRTWLFLAEIHYNVKPILYTNLRFYNKYLAGHFNDYPLWIARYNHREPTLACGRDWQFWQYGNRGRLDGISGDVDFNVFNGSYPELLDMGMKPKPVLSVVYAGEYPEY